MDSVCSRERHSGCPLASLRKSDCDPELASFDSCYMFGLDSHIYIFIFHIRYSILFCERDTTMDSADASDLPDFLSNNNTRMDGQEEQMLATGRAV